MDVKNFIASNPKSVSGIKPIDKVEISEILSERTANAKVSSLGGNKRRAKIYSGPIHYKDIDGEFKSIDTSVKKKKGTHKYQYETNAGNYRAHFDKDKPWNYRFEADDRWIEFEALFDESENLTIEVETTKLGIKENITLLNNEAPTVLNWKFTSNNISLCQPTAEDANYNRVNIESSIVGNILTYTINTDGKKFPIIVDPTTIKASTDGLIYGGGVTDYPTARDAVTGVGVAADFLSAGQRLTAGPTNNVFRTFMSFVGIPEMTSCDSCSLIMYGTLNKSTTDFHIYIYTSDYTAIQVSDYNTFDGWRAGHKHNGTVLNNSWNTSKFSLGDWNTLVFNASGKAAVLAQSEGTLKICVISREDQLYSFPADDEYVRFASHLGATDPYISFTYTVSQDITVGAEATLEAEIDVDIALQVPIETTVEAEIEGDKALTTPIEAMVEAEVEVGTTMAITIPIEATVEAELSTSSRITTPIEATVEPEVEVNTSLTTPIEATVEAEIDIDLALQVNVEATVEAELEATKAIQTPIEATVEAEISSGNRTGKWMVIDAEMDFSGATSGQNPNWLLIPDYLNWMGEWNALTSYDDRDVVLYVTDDGEYHGFVSKSNHNVGNIPTTSYQHWTRLIQGVWNK